jgi:hypothetical protein
LCHTLIALASARCPQALLAEQFDQSILEIMGSNCWVVGLLSVVSHVIMTTVGAVVTLTFGEWVRIE